MHPIKTTNSSDLSSEKQQQKFITSLPQNNANYFEIYCINKSMEPNCHHKTDSFARYLFTFIFTLHFTVNLYEFKRL